jgi:hypothetical protein
VPGHVLNTVGSDEGNQLLLVLDRLSQNSEAQLGGRRQRTRDQWRLKEMRLVLARAVVSPPRLRTFPGQMAQ